MAFRLLATGVGGPQPDAARVSVLEAFDGWETDVAPEHEEVGGPPIADRDKASGGRTPGREDSNSHAASQWAVDERIVQGIRLFRASGSGSGSSILPLQRTSVLLLIAVPAQMSSKDLEMFFGDSVADVESLRILRWRSEPEDVAGKAPDGLQAHALKQLMVPSLDRISEFYSAVLHCHSQDSADAVYKENHGRLFFTIPQKSVGADGGPAIGPCCYLVFLEGVLYSRVADVSSKPMPTITGAAYELPPCPMCLERLDASCTGLVTSSRGWLSAIREADACLVSCRTCTLLTCFSARPDMGGQLAESLETACKTCHEPENLWICVVCGNLGCGRYAAGHAKDHSTAFEHRFCMELASGRVWDYAGDVFVHRRLVQMAAASGRFIEMTLPSPADPDGEGPWSAMHSSGGSGGAHKPPDQWHEDERAMELDAVLASQLDYQRSVYEARLRETREQHEEASREAMERLRQEEEQCIAIFAEVAQEEKRQKSLEKRATAARHSCAEAASRLEFTKELNQSMLANRQAMRPAAKPPDKSVGGASVAEEDDALITQLQKRVAELMEQVSGASDTGAGENRGSSSSNR